MVIENSIAEMLEQDQENETKDACIYNMCDGSGEYPSDEYDLDSNSFMQGVDRRACPCKMQHIED